MFTLLDEQRARKFMEEEARREGREEGKLETLIGLVNKNMISVADAAKEARMSLKDFSMKTGIPIQNQ